MDPAERPKLASSLTVRGAEKAIAFYAQAFGAVEAYRLVDPADGRIGYAELRLGGLTLMVSDEYPGFGAISPETLGGSPVRLHLEVADVDTVVARAVSLGAKLPRPVANQFYGMRSGTITDPFGHRWMIATPIETVTSAEMQRRWDGMATEHDDPA